MNLYVCSQKNQHNLLPQELTFLTPVCTNSFVGPDSSERAYGAPADLLAGFKGPYFYETKGGKGWKGWTGEERTRMTEFVTVRPLP